MRDRGEELVDVHPAVEESDQIVGAVMHIDRHPATLMHWPFPDLDELTGPMGEGEVWFTAAFSGGGKTTFVVSVIEAWRTAGRKVYVMPLELDPKRFRTYLACMEVGIRPGDALSGALRGDPSRDGDRARLKDAVHAQVKAGFSDRVRISGLDRIDVKGLEKGLKEAKAFGADVVIVDHIDHIAGGDRTNLYAESVKVNNAALSMARDNGLLLWFTSQLNMEIARGGKDHLAKFAPPMEQHLMFPTAKIQNATGILGLYRPIRKRRPNEGEQEYIASLKAARSGEIDATDALEPGVVGVTAMKLRNRGENTGKKITLGFDRGRVVPLAEKDRYQTGFGGRVHEVYRG